MEYKDPEFWKQHATNRNEKYKAKSYLDQWLESNLLPDWLVRIGIRHQLSQLLDSKGSYSSQQLLERKQQFVDSLKTQPIAINTKEANEQHYECPPEFFQSVLGPRLKYSCGYFPKGTENLAESETAMMNLYLQRMQGMSNNDTILELGCGWGSLSLFLCQQFPQSKYYSVSFSQTQKEFIDKKAVEMGISNLTVFTADMNDFQPPSSLIGKFDWVVCVEMMERKSIFQKHSLYLDLKNLHAMFNRISTWLKPQGHFFCHHFSHKQFAYNYKKGHWMADNFFSGGTMPSDDLFLRIESPLQVRKHWQVNGMHYSKTCELWLMEMYKNRTKIMEIFTKVYSEQFATKWWAYWKIFFMSCSELFYWNKGNEWFVTHILMENTKNTGPKVDMTLKNQRVATIVIKPLSKSSKKSSTNPPAAKSSLSISTPPKSASASKPKSPRSASKSVSKSLPRSSSKKSRKKRGRTPVG